MEKEGAQIKNNSPVDVQFLSVITIILFVPGTITGSGTSMGIDYFYNLLNFK